MLVLSLVTGLALACDGEAAWTALLDALAPGAVPELPLADLRRVDQAVDQVRTCPAAPWQPWVADGAADLLHGRPERERGEPPPCGSDPACAALVPPLVEALRRDRYSSLGHSWLAATVTDRAPALLIEAHGETDAMIAALRAPVELRGLSATWAASGHLRNPRATIQMAWYQPVRSQAVQVFSRLRPSEGVDPALAWSLDMTQAPPAASENARILALLAGAAPEAALEDAGIAWLGTPTDAPAWESFGLAAPPRDAVRPVPEHLALPTGSRAVVLHPLALGVQQLGQGELDAAESSAAKALERASELDIADLQAAALLLEIRVALRSDRPEAALAALDQALALPEIGEGRRDGLLRAAAADAHAVFVVDERFATVDSFLPALVDRALARGCMGTALDFAQASARHAMDLGLFAEALRRSEATILVLDQADAATLAQRAALEGRVPAPWIAALTHPGRVAGKRALAHQLRAEALAQLGAPSSAVQLELDQAVAQARVFGDQPGNVPEILKGGPPRPRGDQLAQTLQASLGPTLEATILSARGDRRALIASQRGNPGDGYLVYIRAADGEAAALHEIWDRARQVLALRDARPQGDPGRALVEQDAAGTLELLLRASTRAAGWPHVDEARQAWSSILLARTAAERQPWRASLVAGWTAMGLGDRAAARTAFDAAVTDLRGRASAVTRHEAAEIDAWSGAMLLAEDQDSSQAFRLLDELRQRRIRRRVGRPPTAWAPSLDQIPSDIWLLSIQQSGWSRAFSAWLSAPTTSGSRRLEQARFELDPLDPDLPLAIRQQVGSAASSTALANLVAWIDQRVPPGAHLLLLSEVQTRGAGLHLLTVGGTPLALRNPLSWAPSLADAIGAIEAPRAQGERIAIGMPVSAQRDDVDPLLPEREIRRLRADQWRWGPTATRTEALALLEGARSAHFSTHGNIDRLDPARTGLLLADGVLGIRDLGQHLRPGAEVVLSACASGSTGPVELAPLDVGFLLAGARTVVATPFQSVHVEAAEVWMRAWYKRRRRGDTPSMAAWRANQELATTMSDPLDWGAFLVVGAD